MTTWSNIYKSEGLQSYHVYAYYKNMKAPKCVEVPKKKDMDIYQFHENFLTN